jgi:hypothetical protein
MIGRLAWLIAAMTLVAGCATPPPTDPRASLTRPIIDQSPLPLIVAEIPRRGVAATMALQGDRGGVTTWRTADFQTLTFRGGVLIATRGLGDDLMSADVTGTLAALQGGPQAGYPRIMSYLDGEGRTQFRAMVCDMAAPQAAAVTSFGLNFPVQLHVETCNTTGQTVTNRYWRQTDGIVRQSEQWIGPGLGTLATERLSR